MGSWCQIRRICKQTYTESGRYSQAYFTIKDINPYYTPNSKSELKLNDTTFKTIDNSYILSSVKNEDLSFLIGCSCGTPIGNY